MYFYLDCKDREDVTCKSTSSCCECAVCRCWCNNVNIGKFIASYGYLPVCLVIRKLPMYESCLIYTISEKNGHWTFITNQFVILNTPLPLTHTQLKKKGNCLLWNIYFHIWEIFHSIKLFVVYKRDFDFLNIVTYLYLSSYLIDLNTCPRSSSRQWQLQFFFFMVVIKKLKLYEI